MAVQLIVRIPDRKWDAFAVGFMGLCPREFGFESTDQEWVQHCFERRMWMRIS